MSGHLKRLALSGLSSEQICDLVRRLELTPQLLRRVVEEEVAAVVTHDQAWLDTQQQRFRGDRPLDEVLDQHGWTSEDLTLHLWRPEALKRFAEQRFAAGAEEEFLRHGARSDQVVYSLIRLRDAGLARELWIRTEEKEADFLSLARQYGEGPEADRMGLIGPTVIGDLHPPLLQETLRRLQPGELHPPQQLGEWWLLIRLETLQPASFDSSMKQRLIQQQMDAFLADRVDKMRSGETLEPLYYEVDA